jgi:hypothetical protein
MKIQCILGLCNSGWIYYEDLNSISFILKLSVLAYAAQLAFYHDNNMYYSTISLFTTREAHRIPC